ncbi:GNAT family N-acetyltransferase [Streptomyces sp. PanSC9]|uniref:GNAT family N-acetyltransferase n=1 Tax=Streptomyces sp. PanSC9 TaxID=1520461 RepID=UPI000F46AAB0|nr:GNAT family N-acetyltransferase [Streptomyces sp. PanSC9]ROP47646.1 methyltransferase family protein [Streptomyces sp. PanSC9]
MTHQSTAAPLAVGPARDLMPEGRAELLWTVQRTLRAHTSLAPRTFEELGLAYDQDRLLVAVTERGDLGGWLLCVRHADGVTQELAGLYVRPGFRGSGTARLLIAAALPGARTSLVLTTRQRFARHLVRHAGFRRCGPRDLVSTQWRGMLADRLRPARLGALISAGPAAGRPALLRHDRPAESEPCPGCLRPVHDGRAFTARDAAFGTGASSRYAACPHCGHLRQVSTGTDVQDVLCEPASPFTAGAMDSATVERLVYRPRARWLARHGVLSPGSRVLDVGCGTGGFLAHLAVRHGVRGTGVEADPVLAARARARGLAVHQADFTRFETDLRYDVVTLFHLLEHCPDPEAVLWRASSLLAPGGALCVEVPVVGGLAGRLYGAHWFPLLPPFHRHIPSRASLAETLRRACPDGRVDASRPIYLPGEYAVSAALLFEPLLPHPHQRRRLGPAAAAVGSVAALTAAGLSLPLEAASAVLHRVVPLAGHHRMLVRTAGDR